MKTLGYFVILLFCFTGSLHAAQVYSGCATPPSTFRHVWYFDPVHGKTQAAGGNGSQASPWNNLQALVQAQTGYAYPLLTTAPYTQNPGAGQPWVVKTGPRIGDSWLIEEGLKPGDRVIVEGLLTVRPGAVVHPVPYQEKPAAAEPKKTN